MLKGEDIQNFVLVQLVIFKPVGTLFDLSEDTFVFALQTVSARFQHAYIDYLIYDDGEENDY